MADQTIPAQYPNTDATTTGAIPADRQPAHSQTTHPSTGAHDPVPEVAHPGDLVVTNTK